MRAGIVGDDERPDDELAGSNRPHIATDLDDDTAIFMAHVLRRVDGLEAAIRPKVRAANAGSRKLDDGVGGFDYFRFRDFLAANVARATEKGS